MGLKSFAFVGQVGSPGGVNSVSGKMKKPKVFVTEGKDVALTGVCVFFIRTNPDKAITPENIHRVRGSSNPLFRITKDHKFYPQDTFPWRLPLYSLNI